MQPTNLKAIARDAALRGDTKTLFHALDLLERVMPIATFMDFCTELEEIRLQGARPRPYAPAVKREAEEDWSRHYIGKRIGDPPISGDVTAVAARPG